MSKEHDYHSISLETNSEAVGGEQRCRSESSDDMAMLLGQMQKLKDMLKESQHKAQQVQSENSALRQQLAAAEEAFHRHKMAGGQGAEEFSSGLKRQLAEAQLENGRYKQRLEKLSHIVLERERKIAELQQYEMNFRKMGEQKLSLDALSEKQGEQIRVFHRQNEQMHKELEESQQHGKQLERVIHFLRERQEEARLETNQFREEYQKAQTVIAEQQEIIKTSEEKGRELEVALEKEKMVKEEAFDEVKALHSQFELLKKIVVDSKEQLALKSSQEGEAQTAVSSLTAEKNRLESVLKQTTEHLHSTKGALEEIEARLKMAQQHLAKKVKETSDLNDRIHTQDLAMQDLQNHLNQARSRIAEQQQTIEHHFQQERRLQDQLLEASRSTESIVTKWEEKYFKVYEKWQENEGRMKELKKLEEKYLQLQTILSNIGGLFGTHLIPSIPPHIITQPIEERISSPSFPKEESKSKEIEADSLILKCDISQETSEQELGESDHKGPYQNLFDMPKQLKRPKYNLFE